MSLFELALEVLSPYKEQANTGNCYEIFTYLEDLRKMGITDEELNQLEPLITEICKVNNKSKADQKIKNAFYTTKKIPKGNGLFINGEQVAWMKNVTQDDKYGDTSDKIFILNNGTEVGESIVGGSSSEISKLKKCIQNPTSKRYGCEHLIPQFEHIAEKARGDYKNEMTRKYGEDQTKWHRKKSDAQIGACSEVAYIVAQTFNNLPEDERKNRMIDLLRCKDNKVTADLLREVSKDCKSSKSYVLKNKDVKKTNPTFVADGIWLKMFLDNIEVGKTQVKFNNGVNSSIHTSWNTTAHLSKLFDLMPTSQS